MQMLFSLEALFPAGGFILSEQHSFDQLCAEGRILTLPTYAVSLADAL